MNKNTISEFEGLCKKKKAKQKKLFINSTSICFHDVFFRWFVCLLCLIGMLWKCFLCWVLFCFLFWRRWGGTLLLLWCLLLLQLEKDNLSVNICPNRNTAAKEQHDVAQRRSLGRVCVWVSYLWEGFSRLLPRSEG